MPIVLYVSGDGPHCVAKRRELEARGVALDVVDVSLRPDAIPELLKLTGGRRLVPVVVEGARIQVAPDGADTF